MLRNAARVSPAERECKEKLRAKKKLITAAIYKQYCESTIYYFEH
jgi:hypothetical protein